MDKSKTYSLWPFSDLRRPAISAVWQTLLNNRSLTTTQVANETGVHVQNVHKIINNTQSHIIIAEDLVRHGLFVWEPYNNTEARVLLALNVGERSVSKTFAVIAAEEKRNVNKIEKFLERTVGYHDYRWGGMLEAQLVKGNSQDRVPTVRYRKLFPTHNIKWSNDPIAATNHV